MSCMYYKDSFNSCAGPQCGACPYKNSNSSSSSKPKKADKPKASNGNSGSGVGAFIAGGVLLAIFVVATNESNNSGQGHSNDNAQSRQPASTYQPTQQAQERAPEPEYFIGYQKDHVCSEVYNATLRMQISTGQIPVAPSLDGRFAGDGFTGLSVCMDADGYEKSDHQLAMFVGAFGQTDYEMNKRYTLRVHLEKDAGLTDEIKEINTILYYEDLQSFVVVNVDGTKELLGAPIADQFIDFLKPELMESVLFQSLDTKSEQLEKIGFIRSWPSPDYKAPMSQLRQKIEYMPRKTLFPGFSPGLIYDDSDFFIEHAFPEQKIDMVVFDASAQELLAVDEAGHEYLIAEVSSKKIADVLSGINSASFIKAGDFRNQTYYGNGRIEVPLRTRHTHNPDVSFGEALKYKTDEMEVYDLYSGVSRNGGNDLLVDGASLVVWKDNLHSLFIYHAGEPKHKPLCVQSSVEVWEHYMYIRTDEGKYSVGHNLYNMDGFVFSESKTGWKVDRELLAGQGVSFSNIALVQHDGDKVFKEVWLPDCENN